MGDDELETIVLITGAELQQVARQTINRELSGVELRRLRLKLEAGRSSREQFVQDTICELLNVKKLRRWDVSWTEYHETTVTAENEIQAVEVAAEYAGGHSTLMDSDAYEAHEHVDLGDAPESQYLMETDKKNAADGSE